MSIVIFGVIYYDTIVNTKFRFLSKNTDIILFADRNNPKALKVQEGFIYLDAYVENRYIELIGLSLTDKTPKFDSLISVSYPHLSISYPYSIYEDSHHLEDICFDLRNFVCNKNNTIACTFNEGKDSEYVLLRILLDRRKVMVTKSIINIVTNWNYLSFGADYFVDTNLNGTYLLTDRGHLINILNGRHHSSLYSFGLYSGKTADFKDHNMPKEGVYGAVYMDDNHIITHNSGGTFIVSHRLTNNNGKTNYVRKAVPAGELYLGQPRTRNLKSPLSVSMDGNFIAFQAADFNHELNDFNNEDFNLMLKVLNIKSFQVQSIIKISEKPIKAIYDQSVNIAKIIEWQPSKDNDLIALASKQDIKIISVKDKKIIKELPNTNTKSMRWSPDGKKLGYLNKERTIGYSSKKVITPSSLWIYDLEKDQLTKITEDPDYIDFLWVNR